MSFDEAAGGEVEDMRAIEAGVETPVERVERLDYRETPPPYSAGRPDDRVVALIHRGRAASRNRSALNGLLRLVVRATVSLSAMPPRRNDRNARSSSSLGRVLK